MQVTALDLLLLRIVVPIALLTLWYVTWITEKRIRRVEAAFRQKMQEQASTLRAQNEYITSRAIKVISIGDVWRPEKQKMNWKVVDIDKDRIMLAGPDKASTVQYITKYDLLSKWKLVKRSD